MASLSVTRSLAAESTWTRPPARRTRLQGAVGYLELHIEQGPVLLDGRRSRPAVSGTFGVERHLVMFIGPGRPRRIDADAAAPGLAGGCRAGGARDPRQRDHHGGVATVGRMDSRRASSPRSPGSTEMQLDQRHLDADELAAMLAEASESAAAAAGGVQLHRRGAQRLSRHADPVSTRTLVELSRGPACRKQAETTASRSRADPCTTRPRSAGVVPTAMIFAQSDPPISHAAIEDSPQQALERRDRCLRANRGAVSRLDFRDRRSAMNFGVVLKPIRRRRA